MKKKPPNKEERKHMSNVADLGCIICSNNHVEIHHITTARGYGARASHYDVLPLCFMHHRGGPIGVAVHSGVRTWEANFGTQKELLEKVKSMLTEL